MNKLLAIADDLIKNRLNSPLSFYEREKITGIAGNPQDSILYRFLTIEIESRDDGFVPMFFEEAFGYKDEMYHINGVKLRGQIDRIDINRSEKLFKVIDYKLGGKAPGKPQLEKGTALQLPIYLNAAREVIKKKLNEDYKPHSAIIYSLKYEADKFKKDVIIEDRPRKLSPIDAITISAEKIPEYMDSISIGAFGLNGEQRDKETCKYCNFSNTCRLEGDK
jgi:ATP-dependent helicase/DNAse subunit B